MAMVKATISDHTIKSIKEIAITSILDKEEIAYKRHGKEAVTLCPWHNDKNPSLTINDEKGFCFCFVCQTGDDGIGFIKQYFNLSFADAIEKIARGHNVEMIYENIDPELAAKEAKRKAEILNQLNEQQSSYRKFLKDPRATRIREYLDSRDILAATSRYFELGYCPSGFFADRITVPIHDHRGCLIGFTGRATNDEIKPKYKNSENSDHFDKSKIVFNEYRALEAVKETDCLIFVEGHFDVISLYQYGIRNVVAMQGTSAPSETTLHRLAKRTKKFILCYDADEGGNKAIEQFIKTGGPMACRGEVTITIAALPAGTDPDQCVREQLVDMFSVIENSRPWLDWQLESWLTNVDRNDIARFTLIEKNVRSLVESIQSPVLRQYYIDKASKILASDTKTASKIAKNWVENLTAIKQKKVWVKPTPLETKLQAEKRLIRMYIHFPDAREECKPLMDKIQSPTHGWLWQRIKEIEQFSDLKDMPSVLMALLCTCEPHYTRQLRPIVLPTIKLTEDPAILNHIRYALDQELIIDGI